jgi:hypothetical protein
MKITDATYNLRTLVTSGINQSQTLKKNGQDPTTFIKQFIPFYTKVAGLPAQLRNSLIDKFESNGFTREGLEATQEWINDNVKVEEEDMPDLSTMIESFIPNVALTVETLKG